MKTKIDLFFEELRRRDVPRKDAINLIGSASFERLKKKGCITVFGENGCRTVKIGANPYKPKSAGEDSISEIRCIKFLRLRGYEVVKKAPEVKS